MAKEFSWMPIHREAIRRILAYREDHEGLLNVLREMKREGLKVISLEDRDSQGNSVPLTEIDPFTFLATFNRGVTDKNRKDNWMFLKKRWDLRSPVPEDFTGLPVLHNLCSWLFPYAAERESGHVGNLWDIASRAADGEIGTIDKELFDACLKLPRVAIGGLTIGMFWINPEKFLPADHKTKAYAIAQGIEIEPEDYDSYRQWTKDMTGRFGQNYPEISHTAHLFVTREKTCNEAEEPGSEAESCRYWILSPGRGAEYWEEFSEQGIIAIGWNVAPDPDLRQFRNKEEIRQKLLELEPDGSSKTNDSLALWQFVHDVKKGDIVFVKQGRTKLVGYGVVEGDYVFDPEQAHYKHVRNVRWLARGEWEMPKERPMALKTLTDITRQRDFVKLIADTVGLEAATAQGGNSPAGFLPSHNVAYW